MRRVDPTGVITTVAGGGVASYQYNLDRQMTRVTRPDGLQLNYGYDEAGRLQTLTQPNGVYTFAYSAATGQLTGVTAPGGNLTYQYDGFLPTRFAWSGSVVGNVAFTYDNDLRLAAQQINGAHLITFTYDADSLLTGAGAMSLTRAGQNGLLTGSTLGGVSGIYTYNGFGEVTGYTAKFNATTLLAVQYSYDKLGRITQKVENMGGVASTYSYIYDLAGRLIEVKRTMSASVSTPMTATATA